MNFHNCDLLTTTPAAATASASAPTASAATEAITAAALKVLEALALLSAPRPILSLALHVLHFGGRTSA
jgi:hypothetical protein